MCVERGGEPEAEGAGDEERRITNGNAPNDLRIAIIGAGMAGILSTVKLREAGLTNYVIYEKANRLGGTWRENSYPGIACDVPSHLYSYSFEPNPDWTHQYSPGAEIQAYFEGVAEKYGIDKEIRFGDEAGLIRSLTYFIAHH